MATRQEIQIAQDLVRFTNIMNDLLDNAAWMAREIDSQTGKKLQFQEEDKSFRDFTHDEIMNSVKRTGQNVLNYVKMINTFQGSYDSIALNAALQSFGVSLVDIQKDIDSFEVEAKHLVLNIESSQTKIELISFADRLDQNVSKLPLIRRSWHLG